MYVVPTVITDSAAALPYGKPIPSIGMDVTELMERVRELYKAPARRTGSSPVSVSHASATANAFDTATGETSADAAASTTIPFQANSWLAQALSALAEARENADAAGLPYIATAELLLPHLAFLAEDVRPHLGMDDDGHPTFARSTDNFYLDLTIDAPDSLTWYAVVNGREHFAENIGFTGRNMPSDLRSIFALRSA